MRPTLGRHHSVRYDNLFADEADRLVKKVLIGLQALPLPPPISKLPVEAQPNERPEQDSL